MLLALLRTGYRAVRYLATISPRSPVLLRLVEGETNSGRRALFISSTTISAYRVWNLRHTMSTSPRHRQVELAVRIVLPIAHRELLEIWVPPQ